MRRLAYAISSLVKDHIDQSLDGGEIRLIFHGPPIEILEHVFDELSRSVSSVPILILKPRLADGSSNPAVGDSGACDDTHLLDLRNSPSRPAFLALVEPGLHSIRSITSTADEFGVSPESNGANVRFNDWWEDSFVQALAAKAFEAAGLAGSELTDAWELARLSGQAFDDMDSNRSRRKNAWHFLSRLYSIVDAPAGLPMASRLSLALGIPPTDDGKLSAKEQASIITKISDAMTDGFGAGIRSAKAEASDEDAQRLDEFHSHLAATCDIPTTFERATPYFYAPFKGLELDTPPTWWTALTSKKWAELLAEDTPEQADIEFTCTNALVELPRGMPALVEDEACFSFGTPQPEHYGTEVSLDRGRTNICNVILDVEDVPCTDASVANHKSPLRYVASAEGFKSAAIKVVSLEHWQPGIFVACRQAKKLTPPRKPRGKGTGLPDFEAALTLPGNGRYELLVFTASNVTLHETAAGASEDRFGKDSGEKVELPVELGKGVQHLVQVDADGNYRVEIGFNRTSGDGTVSSEFLSVQLTVEDVPEQGCRGVLERLILLNRRKVETAEKPVVRINRNELSTTLQDWIISEEAISDSFQPLVLADDFEGSWARKPWGSGTGPIFSQGTFLHDPRPNFEDFDPPAEFIEARRQIAKRVRGEDNNSLFEAAELGEWYERDPKFATAVEQYLESYSSWLTSNPEIACWVDVAIVCSLDADGRTLSRIPDAVLLSPMHPARVGWHVAAQRVLWSADQAAKPCPAVSVLDPDCVPDVLTLSIRSPGGIEKAQFLSVENSTDYWSVLWNGNQLKQLPRRSARSPFGPNFGILVGGISTSFTAGQVTRALDDVSGLLSAKSKISLVVDGSDGTSTSCNEGIVQWSASRLGKEKPKKALAPAGPRSLDVFDHRGLSQRPDDATIANLSQDTGNRVRWFERQPETVKPDLGIISQLDMAEPTATNVDGRSPLGFGGLLRHRVRRQLPNAFMSETRQSVPTGSFDDVLANKVAACIASLESQADIRTGISFAPNVNSIKNMLEERDAQYVATSSAAVDPAAFLGGWLEEAYLWDYDLPSYSRRSGDTNGYYLLSKVKSADLEALARSVSRLPGCQALDSDQMNDMLHEIARRGIPTVRGMSGEDTGSTGDLGVFVAARLLQDTFRPNGGFDSLVPIFEGESEDDASICIIVPVDPFRGFIEDLAKSLAGQAKIASLSRPDLLSIGVRISGDDVRIHLTPMEVKCHPDSTFRETSSALDQARNLSQLLCAMLPHEGQPAAWSLGFQHLLLSIVNFGMRVYSQNRGIADKEALWSRFHERIAAAILSPFDCVTVDQRGRLIVVDNNPRSGVKDHDSDGFDETINISSEDAGRIVSGAPDELYSQVRARVGRWELIPEAGQAGAVSDNPVGSGIDAGIANTAGDEPGQADSVNEHPIADGTVLGLVGEGEEKPTVSIVAEVQDGEPDQGVTTATVEPDLASLGVRLAVGKTVDSFQPRELELNISDTRLNQLNMGVVGDLGTGKTQLLKSLIYQISASGPDNRGAPPRFLIFDYKRDYSSPEFVEATGAKVVLPHRLPLNLFDTSSMGQSLNPRLDRFRFFTDVLDKIYSGVGPVQRAKLKAAVEAAYQSCLPGQQPTLYDVHAAYAEILDGKSDSPMAIIDDLVDMEVFSPDHSKTVPFDEFLDGVVVISLDAFGQDDRSKNMLVAVMLNMFYENMLKTEKKPFLGKEPQLRAIDSFLLVDEADNIMKYEFDVLRKLLLQGREFGTGVILASQYLRHFKVNATDYREPLLSWFIHKVPNITPAELSALGLSGSSAEAAERIRSLEVHQCLYKSHDVPGEIIRGKPFFEIMEGPQAKATE